MKMSRLFLNLFVFGIFANTFAESHAITSSGAYLGIRGSRLGWKTSGPEFFGYLVGPEVGFDYRQRDNVYVGGRYYMMYDHIASGGCGRGYTDMDMQVRLGFTFGETLLFTPYTGLGVNIVEQTKQSIARQPCNKMAITSIYVPVGLLATYHPSRYFSIGIDYQFMPQVDTHEKISGYKGVRWELHEQEQHSIEIPMQFTFGRPRFKHLQYRLIPFYRTYRYGSAKFTSSLGGSMDLAAQHAYEWGLRYEFAIY